MRIHKSGYAVINHVHNVNANALTHKSVVTAGVDVCTLLVHNVIILKQALTYTKVVLLNLLLGTLNRF